MKFKSLILFSIAFLTVSAGLVSCGNNKYPGYKTTDSGLNIKYIVKGAESEKPVLNSVVTLNLSYRLEDSVLFESSKITEPMRIPIVEPSFKGDFYQALLEMNIGDSVSVAFPADSFFMVTAGMEKLPAFVSAGSPMYFDMKLVDIQSEEEILAEQIALFKVMRAQEQELLTKFLNQSNITVAPKPSGLIFVEQKAGNGRLPKAGDMLQLDFSISTLDGMELFSTKGQAPIDVEFGKEFDTKGFDEGIGYLKKGGIASLIVPSYLAFDSIGRGEVVPPFTTILYNVELLNIRTVTEVEKERTARKQAEETVDAQRKNEEPVKIAQYVKQNSIQVSPRPSGLYFIETLKGSGIKADSGMNVTVHYVLYTLEGKKLQSSVEMGQPFTFRLGERNVIQGWDEGLTLMNEGGKARFIVPSSLAYGGSNKGPDMPAYSTLVFDVELIKVEK
jgi:FKBP-type peptidyl-prolyl cis-trans isomerase